MKFPPVELKAGDTLLYFDGSFVDRVIAIKTWSDVGHVEIYAGNGHSYASRNGIGVNVYPLRLDGLRYVLRPNRVFRFELGSIWFEKDAKGQPYNFRDLLQFCLIRTKGKGMICSQFGAEFYKACLYPVFNPMCPSGTIAPAQFLQTPALDWIWCYKWKTG